MKFPSPELAHRVLLHHPADETPEKLGLDIRLHKKPSIVQCCVHRSHDPEHLRGVRRQRLGELLQELETHSHT